MHRLYVIMGCTGGGKAALGTELARRHGGQIVSVDSMKIYRQMDIGTAKPSPAIRAEIPFHAVDVTDPWVGSEFTVNDYATLADAAIDSIVAAGGTAFAVGGTNLYLKALLEGMFEGPGSDAEFRAGLHARAETEGTPALHAELADVDAVSAERIHPNDLRRIVRALEVQHLTGTPISELQRQWDAGAMRYDCRIVLLRREREDTNGRINARVRRMIDGGLLDEARRLWDDRRELNRQAAAAVGYAELFRHFRGEWPLDEAVERIKINTRRFAKNQRTWFRHFAQAAVLEATPDAQPDELADAAEKLLGLHPGGAG